MRGHLLTRLAHQEKNQSDYNFYQQSPEAFWYTSTQGFETLHIKPFVLSGLELRPSRPFCFGFPLERMVTETKPPNTSPKAICKLWWA